MAYIINKTDGNPLLTLEDGTLNQDYGVGLMGKNTIGYGEVQNENFVHLLENFAGSAPPAGTALKGQVYFNTINNQLNVYDGVVWNVVGDAIASDTAPSTTVSGSTWLKTTTQQLYVYNNGWQLIGPEAVETFGATRAIAASLKDTVGLFHAVVKVVVNDVVIAIFSSDIFTIDSSNAIAGFTSLKAGVTTADTVDIKGSLDGNALTSTKLQTPRLINGQPFDGSADITVTATASQTHIRGNYLTGGDFNGSANVEWAVDATVASSPNKVVVRDDKGDFAARTISANLVGDVRGNVSTLTGTSQFNEVVATHYTGNLTGGVTGNASTADRLKVVRAINGVNFDGSQNIVIKSSTTNPLVAGQYIQGDQFDGSVGRSWNVLATPNNDAGKIVARDANGNFVANTITANITGNVAGNVTATTGVSNFNVVNANQLVGSLTGNATGNAGSATKLRFARTINDVNFDGSSDIYIKAPTTNPLLRGAYLTGDNFDGSIASVRWAVDATTENTGNKIVARNANGNFSAGTITANLVGSVSGSLTGPVYGNVSGNTTGTHYGPVIGNVSGNVTGSASNNISRYGDTMTGDLEIVKPNAWLTLDSPSDQDNGNYQAAGISLGESGKKGSATLHLTYTGDGYGHIGMGPIDNVSSLPQFEAMRLYYLNNNVQFFGTITAPTVNATTLSGNGSGVTSLNASQLSTGYVPTDRLSGTYPINISGNAAANVSRYGDSMSGYLTLPGAPVNANHAATKAYVDAAAGYTFTYGNTWYTNWFTNWVGNWSNDYNYFDVFPPYGKTMYNLIAFIPSIAVIHFAGGVNGDDSMRCTWSWYGDRIRVYVQNTEQRWVPAANWLAIWR